MVRRPFAVAAEYALARLGLFLILLLTRLVGPASMRRTTIAGRAASFLARRAIDVMALVGRAADQLPLPAYARRRTAREPVTIGAPVPHPGSGRG